MRVKVVSAPDVVEPTARARVTDDVSDALNSIVTGPGGFVINDSIWHWKNAQGTVTPTVVNSATFISKKFQEALVNRGWVTEKKISGQTIDAYLEVPLSGDAFSIAPANLLNLFPQYLSCNYGSVDAAPMDRDLSRLYQCYVARKKFRLEPSLALFDGKFKRAVCDTPLRVGLEFETGNIASSFRAIAKLEGLFANGHIDLGIFITSLDKASCAARIWPISNRNGSFEELQNRNYEQRRVIPTIDIGFAPDGFSNAAKYLGANGTLFDLKNTGNIEKINGADWEIWTDPKGKRFLRPDV